MLLHHVTTSGTGRHRTAPGGTGRLRPAPGGTGRLRPASGGTGNGGLAEHRPGRRRISEDRAGLIGNDQTLLSRSARSLSLKRGRSSRVLPRRTLRPLSRRRRRRRYCVSNRDATSIHNPDPLIITPSLLPLLPHLGRVDNSRPPSPLPPSPFKHPPAPAQPSPASVSISVTHTHTHTGWEWRGGSVLHYAPCNSSFAYHLHTNWVCTPWLFEWARSIYQSANNVLTMNIVWLSLSLSLSLSLHLKSIIDE